MKIVKMEFLAENPKGSVQIIHGMREHSGRYVEFAKYLCENGYSVFLSTHPYHGENWEEADWKENFFEIALQEQLKYSVEIKNRFFGKPLYTLGHSMGSFLLQRYMQVENIADGYIHSGSCGKRWDTLVGERVLTLFLNNFRDRKSRAFEKIIFFGFHKDDVNDWLTRDKKIYQEVKEDPYWIKCYPLSFYRDFFSLLNTIFLKGNLESLDRKKPIYIFSGDEDPVGLHGKGIKKLIEQYKQIGCENLQWKLYLEGRHEMLNEVNKEEVYKDVVTWLDNGEK